MEPGKIVFIGKSKKDKTVVIRYPAKSDVEVMCRYINALSAEKTYIRFQGESISLEEEEKFLFFQLQKISKHVAIQLLLFANDELIGTADIEMLNRTDRHVGELGISIAKQFRGEGLGLLLMQVIIEEAIKNLPDLEIITLCVFSNNLIGITLYEKLGFIKYGILPKGVKLLDGYVDLLLMYKPVQKDQVKASLDV